MKYIPISLLPVLIIMVVGRARMLRKQGIKAFVFGETDKSDFILLPVVFSFFYAIVATVFDLPLPEILKRYFWEIPVFYGVAIGICSVSLVWFFITLKTFGKSFRVGIDENTKDALITNGVFAISRNPIYMAFIAFFIGIFMAYPNIITIVFLLVLTSLIHRQILREEKFLSSHYGQEYEEYCEKVRRYI